jgi:hypothetical protein
MIIIFLIDVAGTGAVVVVVVVVGDQGPEPRLRMHCSH